MHELPDDSVIDLIALLLAAVGSLCFALKDRATRGSKAAAETDGGTGSERNDLHAGEGRQVL